MASTSWGRGLAVVAMVLAIAAGYRWWASDARAIRNQLAAIAQSLTVTAHEGDLGRVTRFARLRNALAPDIRVLASGPPPALTPGEATQMPQELAGRDSVLALVGQWRPPPGGVTVEFVDVQVTIGGAEAAAQVYCTAKITSRDAAGQQTVDARELTAEFAKADGAWVVTAVQLEDTLAR